MQTARILTIAALSAFATLGAQAAELNGDLYGTDFESKCNRCAASPKCALKPEGSASFNDGPPLTATPDPQRSMERHHAVRSNGAIALRAKQHCHGRGSRFRSSSPPGVQASDRIAGPKPVAEPAGLLPGRHAAQA